MSADRQESKAATMTHRPEERIGGLGWVRTVFYLHLATVVGCAFLSLSDAGQIQLPPRLESWLLIFMSPMVFAWLVCPLAMMCAVSFSGRSRRFRFLAVGADVLLSAFQLWVLLPLVQ
jgi:hypothetical protein